MPFWFVAELMFSKLRGIIEGKWSIELQKGFVVFKTVFHLKSKSAYKELLRKQLKQDGKFLTSWVNKEMGN